MAAVAVGVIALALRVWGRGWSLPYVDHPDEPAVIDVVLRIVQGQANPDFFFYPSLMLYLHALLLKFHFWWGLQTGLYAAPTIPTTLQSLLHRNSRSLSLGAHAYGATWRSHSGNPCRLGQSFYGP